MVIQEMVGLQSYSQLLHVGVTVFIYSCPNSHPMHNPTTFQHAPSPGIKYLMPDPFYPNALSHLPPLTHYPKYGHCMEHS